MSTHAFEVYRAGFWVTVLTVQDDLFDDVVSMFAADPLPGVWRIRHVEPPEPTPGVVAEVVPLKPLKMSWRYRLRLWWLFRTSRTARMPRRDDGGDREAVGADA